MDLHNFCVSMNIFETMLVVFTNEFCILVKCILIINTCVWRMTLHDLRVDQLERHPPDTMSEEAGTSIRYTNHSLRATSTTRLFASNIPEKVIQEKSGHRSLAGLRAYEKTTTSQERSVTKILTSIENFPEAEEINCQIAVQKPLKEDKKKLPPTNMFTGELHNCVFNFHL